MTVSCVQRVLAEELAATRKRLVDTQEELDAWQRQTMVRASGGEVATQCHACTDPHSATAPRHNCAHAAGGDEAIPYARSHAGAYVPPPSVQPL